MQNKNIHQKNIENRSDSLSIKKKITNLKRRYDTNDPFDIAKSLGIKVIFEELGSISGYYNKQLRMKQIHINYNLEEHTQKFTCAHELGHAILHPNANTPFLRSNTLLSIDKLEAEANKFAMELLIPNEILLENIYLTSEQLSRLLGYHQKLIELRLTSFLN